MATLTGNKIKDTYTSLIKFSDNGTVDSSLQLLSDGAGNSIGVSVDNSGNISSAAVGTLIGTSSTGVVNNGMMAANSIDSDQYVDGSIDTVHIADDAITFEKVDAEFTTSSALTAGATVAVDFDAAQVFTLTPNANTTFNVTNPKIGVTKTLIVTGAGGSYTADTWQVGGVSGTFNRIAGTYDDTSSTKNFYQITCVSATEFWYSISQIAS